MVAAACQHHIKPTAKISSPISATFRPYLSSVEGSGFLHVYLSPVVIFPLYASKADRSSKETPLSYMLNRFDPGLASSNLCLCFKNQISADKEALLKINFTQSVSEAGAKNRRKKDVVCSIKDSSSTAQSCVWVLCYRTILIAQTTSADSSSYKLNWWSSTAYCNQPHHPQSYYHFTREWDSQIYIFPDTFTEESPHYAGEEGCVPL